MKSNRIRAVLFLGLIAAVTSLIGACQRHEATDDPVTQDQSELQSVSQAADPAARAKVEAFVAQGDYQSAERIVKPMLIENPDSPRAYELAGDIAVALGQPDAARDRYAAAVDRMDPPDNVLRDKLGRQWLACGFPYQSVELLKEMLATEPDNPNIRRDLAGLLASLALERRAAEHLRHLVMRGQAGVGELIILTDLTRPQTDESICRLALEKNPDDLRPLYALARQSAYDGDWNAAIEDLERVWNRHPNFAEGSAYYGRALVETGLENPANNAQSTEVRLQRWIESVPAGIVQQPQYWIAAGIWAEKQGNQEQAVKAFWNAARLAENDGEALSRFASALVATGRREESKAVAERAAMINAMRDDVESFFFWRNHSQRAAVKIAQSQARLGRLWEAASWARFAAMMTQDPAPSAREVFTEIRGQMTGRTPWQLPEASVTAELTLDDLPDVAWKKTPAATTESIALAESEIRLVDQAAQRGLEHTCGIGPVGSGESGLAIYQSGAGGAAVIDYDRDGFPDFYLTQCDGTPQKTDSSPNRLFRNCAGQFFDVTEVSSSVDHGYAQGLAAGDFNSDGFADLMIGNFGINRLLKNNGDGTFTDVTDEAGINGQSWTTSVAIADIDGDSIADLFEVNYVGGDDVITRRCFPDDQSAHRSCGPLVFPAAPDRVWKGTADGRFNDATSAWMSRPDHSVEPGRGLGLVIGCLDQQPGMDLYIANDMSANHFWSQTSSSDSAFQLEEQGAVRGLAFDKRSLSQASMGIAASDADNDGDLDLYLTHFTNEYNTLYMQEHSGLWVDRTGDAALADPTKSLLAYGTQWFDADNNGTVELIVANGNVDDFSHSGWEYRMPMQMFARKNDGTYTELPAEKISDDFAAFRLSRALVTTDFDRDGRVDALVTHLFDPVSLLVNQSPAAASNGAFTLNLIGTRSHRDAIGSVVTLRHSNQSRTQFVLAGDGYQCSNDRQLHFGLGGNPGPVSITVRWPDGTEQSADGLSAQASYQWIQGVSRPRPL